jgi:long-chain fatty acid transport protein
MARGGTGWLRLGLAATAAGLLGGAAGKAAATGFEVRNQSSVAQGTSFAGAAARGDDPSFLFFNPAAMAWLPGTQAALVGSALFPQTEVRSASASRAAGRGGTPFFGSLASDAGLDALLPALHVSTALGEDWRLGLSVTAPWGLSTKYPADFIGRYHALTSSLRTINVAPSVAWRPLPNLALGGALQIQYADARQSTALDFGAPRLADGRATFTGDETAVGWQVGAQWEPLAGTRLGAAFRSALFYELSGEARFESVPAAIAADFAATGGRAKLTTPETLTFGLAQRLDERWTLLAGAEWTNWSRFRELVVRRDDGRPPFVTEQRWRDTWLLSAGAEYRATEALALRAGFAWDRSPVPEETRTPRIPDSDRYLLSVGASWRAWRNITLTVAYTHIFVENAQVRLRAEPGSPDFQRGDLSAAYRTSVDILSVQARFAF